MPQVEFPEERFDRGRFAGRQTPALVGLMMRLGAKDERRANAALIAVAVVAILLTLYVVSTQFGGRGGPAPVGRGAIAPGAGAGVAPRAAGQP